MSFGESDMLLLDFIERYGFITAEAAGVLLGTNANTAGKRLARLEAAKEIEKAAYLWPRCIWKPNRKLGGQALKMRAPLLCYCLHGKERFDFERWDGPAAICTGEGKKEAVFIDLAGTPDHVARKLRDYCRSRNLDGFTGLTVLVPAASKGQKVYRSASGHRLPLPVRCVVIDDLRRLLHETRDYASG